MSVSNAQSEIDQLHKQLHSLRSKHIMSNESIEECEGKINTARKQIQELQKHIDGQEHLALKLKREQLLREIGATRALEGCGQRIHAAEERAREVQPRIDEHEDKARKLKMEKCRLLQQIEALEGQVRFEEALQGVWRDMSSQCRNSIIEAGKKEGRGDGVVGS